jgi:hypothetical protein
MEDQKMKSLLKNIKKIGVLAFLGLMLSGMAAPAAFADDCGCKDQGAITGGSIDTPG